MFNLRRRNKIWTIRGTRDAAQAQSIYAQELTRIFLLKYIRVGHGCLLSPTHSNSEDKVMVFYAIKYTVIFCNFACINIFIIGDRCFTKNITEKQFYRQVLLDTLIIM